MIAELLLENLLLQFASTKGRIDMQHNPLIGELIELVSTLAVEDPKALTELVKEVITLAKKHPDVAQVIEKVEEVIKKRGGEALITTFQICKTMHRQQIIADRLMAMDHEAIMGLISLIG